MQNSEASVPRRVSAAHIVVPGKTSNPSTDPRRVSAANLSVPKSKPATRPAPARCVPPRTAEEWSERVDHLEALRDELRPVRNQNDVAVALVAACISSGICTKDKIVGMLVRLGLKGAHAGAIVDSGARPPVRWRKGADGRYSLVG